MLNGQALGVKARKGETNFSIEMGATSLGTG